MDRELLCSFPHAPSHDLCNSYIYKLLGEDDDISDGAGTISIWFIPVFYTFVFAFTMQMFLNAQMKNIFLMYLSSAFFVVHVLLTWLFVDKLNLGIPGAMGAMVIVVRWLYTSCSDLG